MMTVFTFDKYDLLLSYDPCSIFRYYNVTGMHGLDLGECQAHSNTTESAYIAGWCNISPTNGKYFVFINLSRCTNDIKTTGLIMHELMHLAGNIFQGNWETQEEEMITFAEEETYKVVNIVKNVILENSF
jgi:hypothetical protein